MEVHFTPEQAAQISQISTYIETPPEQLVNKAALRLVAEDTEIRADIERGIAQSDRGELVDHEELPHDFTRCQVRRR
jgi:predicted transcriptional regulator